MCDKNGIAEQEDNFQWYDKQLEAEIAKRATEVREKIGKAFEEKPKHGIHAHAYKNEVDNNIVYELKHKGKSLQQIADVFGCSKSTIRNRLNRMKGI